MPWGQWSFELVVTVTSQTGPCAGVSPPTSPQATVGPAGGTSFQFVEVASGTIATVYWSGGVWNLLYQQSGPQDWTLCNLALTWDGTSKSWKGSDSRIKVSGSACSQDLDFEWLPRAWMAEQVVRAEFDELTDDLAAAWSWRSQADELPGAVGKFIHRTGNLWTPGHVRGLTRKLGTAGVPGVLDPFVEWTY